MHSAILQHKRFSSHCTLIQLLSYCEVSISKSRRNYSPLTLTFTAFSVVQVFSLIEVKLDLLYICKKLYVNPRMSLYSTVVSIQNIYILLMISISINSSIYKTLIYQGIIKCLSNTKIHLHRSINIACTAYRYNLHQSI